MKYLPGVILLNKSLSYLIDRQMNCIHEENKNTTRLVSVSSGVVLFGSVLFRTVLSGSVYSGLSLSIYFFVRLGCYRLC